MKLKNRLNESRSPYVRGHMHNPVAWQMWGPEAIELAKKSNRLIFISIGYAACHWCHVMERESFEDPRIAELMNEEPESPEDAWIEFQDGFKKLN